MRDADCPRRRLGWGRRALLVMGVMLAGVMFVAAQPAVRTAGKARANLPGDPAKAPGRATSSEDMPGAELPDALKSNFQGRRDPFRLPLPPSPRLHSDIDGGKAHPKNVVLPPGPSGLVIAQLRVEGIVSENTTHQMIAVVTNDTNRAYFLRENEELYDGVVSRITPSAVYFEERARNSYGAATEIVKTLNPASGELK